MEQTESEHREVLIWVQRHKHFKGSYVNTGKGCFGNTTQWQFTRENWPNFKYQQFEFSFFSIIPKAELHMSCWNEIKNGPKKMSRSSKHLITPVIKHWHIPFLVPDYAATTRDTTLSRVYNNSPLLISSLWNVGGLYDVVRYIMSVMIIFYISGGVTISWYVSNGFSVDLHFHSKFSRFACYTCNSHTLNLTRWSRVLRDTAASQLNDTSRSAGA